MPNNEDILEWKSSHLGNYKCYALKQLLLKLLLKLLTAMWNKLFTARNYLILVFRSSAACRDSLKHPLEKFLKHAAFNIPWVPV